MIIISIFSKGLISYTLNLNCRQHSFQQVNNFLLQKILIMAFYLKALENLIQMDLSKREEFLPHIPKNFS